MIEVLSEREKGVGKGSTAAEFSLPDALDTAFAKA